MAKNDSDKIIADQTKEIAALRTKLKAQSNKEALESETLVNLQRKLVKLKEQELELQNEKRDLIDKSAQLVKDAYDADVAGDRTKAASLHRERKLLQAKIKLIAKEQTFNKQAISSRNAQIVQEQTILTLKEKQQEFVEKYSDEIEEQLGFLDSIDDVIKEIPVVGGVLSKALGLDDIKKELSEKMLGAFKAGLQGAATGAGGIMAGLRGAAVAAKGLLVSMGPLLPIALALAAAFVALKRAFEIDEEVTNLAKNLDVSKHAAHEIHHTAIGIAKEMKTVGVNSGEVLKVMEELKTSMGYNVGLMADHNQAARELVKSTTLLVEKQGLSTEEAVNLNRAAVATGVPLDNMSLMAKSMGDELMSGREIMQDLGKVSNGVLINFSKNPAALVKAVKQAKLLGTTLDEMKSAGEGLLNIESSIENEMKARVLTGKNINLNQARYYAMLGKTDLMMEEIAKQAGSAADYEKMMPMQRKALAEAMSLTVEQLDKMMLQQKELETLGYSQTELQEKLALKEGARASELDRLRKLGKEDAANLLAAKYAEEDRVAANKKLADIGKKIMDIFDKIVSGPLGDMVNDLLNMLTTSEAISVITKGIGATFYYLKAIVLDAFMPIRIAFNTLTGIYKFLTGDFMGAWEDVKDIVDAILAPFKAIIDGVKFVTGIKGSEHSNYTTTNKDKAQFDKDYGPGALEKQAAQMSGTTNVPGTKQMTPEAKKFKETSDYIDSLIEPITRFRFALFAPGESNDFISRPGQPIQKFNKDDIIIGATSPFSGDSTGDSDMLNELKKQNELLQAILASTNQPTLIQIGNRTIEEIGSKTGMRRNFTTTGIGNTYGKTLPGY